MIFGMISGLMMDVHLTNAVFLLIPFLEVLPAYYEAWRARQTTPKPPRILRPTLLYMTGILAAFSPTLVTRQIIFGNPFGFGAYTDIPWNWTSPAFGGVLFSSNHGVLVCTPIVLLGFAGILLLRRGRVEWLSYLGVILALYCLVSFAPWWDSTVGFGNRYFISLTPLFTLGLAVTFSRVSYIWVDSRAAATWRLGAITVLLLMWNLGLVYQWSTGLIPLRGQVYWDEVLYNQFHVVPREALHSLANKFSPHGEAGT
jgi:hypothetical protein